MKIGKAIQTVRKRKKISQGDAAQAAGITSSYLSLLEKGKKDNPSTELLERIAQAIGVPLGVIYFLTVSSGDPVNGPIVEQLQTTTTRLFGIPEEAVKV